MHRAMFVVTLISSFLLLASSTIWAQVNNSASTSTLSRTVNYIESYLEIYKGNYAFCATTNCGVKNPSDIICNCKLVKNSFFAGPPSLPILKKNQVTSLFLIKNNKSALMCKTKKYIDCYGKPCDLVNGVPQCHCDIVQTNMPFFTQGNSCTPKQGKLPNGMSATAKVSSFMKYMLPTSAKTAS